MRSKLNLSEPVVEKSVQVYRKAVSCKLTRGRNKTILISAAIDAL